MAEFFDETRLRELCQLCYKQATTDQDIGHSVRVRAGLSYFGFRFSLSERYGHPEPDPFEDIETIQVNRALHPSIEMLCVLAESYTIDSTPLRTFFVQDCRDDIAKIEPLLERLDLIEEHLGLPQVRSGVPQAVDLQGGSVTKPGGWTIGELKEACGVQLGKPLSKAKWQRIRSEAGIMLQRGGGSGNRRFTNREIRALADAADRLADLDVKPLSKGHEIARCWRELIGDLPPT